MMDEIKHGLRVFLFLTGLFLFATSSFIMYYGFTNGNMGRKVGEMTHAEFVVVACFFVGAYITTNLLKRNTKEK